MTSQSLTPVHSPKVPATTGAGSNLPIKQSSRQARHLAQAIQLEESGTSPLIRFTMLMASMACLVFVAWAALTRIDEVSTADGQVIPSGSVMSIQHLEGGQIDLIAVKEGELVEEGQTLIKLSPAAAMSDLEQSRAREATLLIKAERLRAFAEHRTPDFSFATRDYERLVVDNQAIFQTQVQARQSSRAVLLAQIEQKRSDLEILEQQHSTLREQVTSQQELVKMRRDLAEQNLVSRATFLGDQRELSRLQGELSRSVGQAITAREALTESQNRLIDQESTLHKQTMDELATVIGELAQVQESIGRLEDRVSRLVVASPARGYVKGLAVHNTGAVIQPGGLVCEVVPVDRELKIEARITTRDVGHLKSGQRVKVKVATYDFARYGAAMGTLQQISASSFLDEKGNPYFKGFISLDNDYVGSTPGVHTIIPGMTVNAEIITGDKTLLQYMLKPIFTQLQQSFHER